jgi:hypothetical protein
MLEQAAKKVDFADALIDLVRSYGFLVNPRPRLGRRPSNGVDDQGNPIRRRRGRPRRSKTIEPMTPTEATTPDPEEE